MALQVLKLVQKQLEEDMAEYLGLSLRACIGSTGLPQWVLHKASADRDG